MLVASEPDNTDETLVYLRRCVSGIPDTALQLVRTRNPGICVFARAKFPGEAARLQALGAHVIHDERESATAMIDGVMTSYQRNEIDPREIVREVLGAEG